MISRKLLSIVWMSHGAGNPIALRTREEGVGGRGKEKGGREEVKSFN